MGLVSSGSASVAGYVDWSELDREQLRTGWVHQAVNWVGITLYGLSWMQRKRGNHGAGKLLGFAGLTVVGVGGYLGGHLAYRQRAGVGSSEHVPSTTEHSVLTGRSGDGREARGGIATGLPSVVSGGCRSCLVMTSSSRLRPDLFDIRDRPETCGSRLSTGLRSGVDIPA